MNVMCERLQLPATFLFWVYQLGCCALRFFRFYIYFFENSITRKLLCTSFRRSVLPCFFAGVEAWSRFCCSRFFAQGFCFCAFGFCFCALCFCPLEEATKSRATRSSSPPAAKRTANKKSPLLQLDGMEDVEDDFNTPAQKSASPPQENMPPFPKLPDVVEIGAEDSPLENSRPCGDCQQENCLYCSCKECQDGKCRTCSKVLRARARSDKEAASLSHNAPDSVMMSKFEEMMTAMSTMSTKLDKFAIKEDMKKMVGQRGSWK